MKKSIYIILLLLLVITGCSEKSSENAETSVVLNAGDTLTCSNSTKFTVTPTNDPMVTFTTDAFSGNTSIEVSAESTTSSVEVENCTKV